MTQAQPWSVSMTAKEPGRAKIKMMSGKEEWMKVTERAEPFKNKIADGALVKLSFQGDTISAIFEVDENGNEVKRPAPKSSGGGGWKKADPEQERIKNQFILCESVAARAVDVVRISVERGLDNEGTAKLWEDVLNMTIYGANKITDHVQGGSK